MSNLIQHAPRKTFEFRRYFLQLPDTSYKYSFELHNETVEIPLNPNRAFVRIFKVPDSANIDGSSVYISPLRSNVWFGSTNADWGIVDGVGGGRWKLGVNGKTRIKLFEAVYV